MRGAVVTFVDQDAPSRAMTAGDVAGETIAQVLRDNAARDDGLEFLRLIFPGAPDQVISYAELMAEAGRWTRYFAARGLGRSDRVIVVLPHSLDLYAAYIGALLGACVPAMFAFPSAKLSEEQYFATVGTLIVGSGARLLVTYGELRDRLLTRAAAGLASVALVTPEEVSGARGLPEPVRASADDVAFLQYSSGTTGIKKGVALSHRALLRQVTAYSDAIAIGPADRIVTWLPLYHDMGLIAAFFLPLIRRVPVVAMSPLAWVTQPSLWLRAASEHRATLAWLPNFAFSFLARGTAERDLEQLDLSSLRGVVNCSEPLMAESQDAFVERFARYGFRAEALAASYAMAENTFAVTSGGFPGPPRIDWIDGPAFRSRGECRPATVGGAGAVVMVSSGKPLPDTTVSVVDGDGRPVGERMVGELVVRSPWLMCGYDNNEEATRSGLRDGAFATGDLGYIADGDVFVTGRKKDLIIIGGRNIYPQDIEAALATIDGVIPGRAVACAFTDRHKGTEALVLLVETDVSDEQGRVRLRRAIYDAAVRNADAAPSDIRLLPPRWLIKSSSGKPARAANLEKYLAERESTAGDAEGGGAGRADEDVRTIVRRSVDRLTGRRRGTASGRVADDMSLFRSGLIDSFGVMEFLADLEGALGRPVPVERLGNFAEFDTIDGVVRLLTAGDLRPEPQFDFDQPVPMTAAPLPARSPKNFWTWWYRLVFLIKGIRCGAGLQVLGPLLLELPGNPHNIRIGRNVTLMPNVHLKVRENGAIVLHDGVKLDTNVRLVAANDATISIGAGSVIGLGTLFNAGADVSIGRNSLISSNCVINASDHGMAAGIPMKSQAYEHAPIVLFDDVWVGAGAFISRGARMARGSVASAGAVVIGDVPPNAVVQGRPARVIKFRL